MIGLSNSKGKIIEDTGDGKGHMTIAGAKPFTRQTEQVEACAQVE